MNATPSLPTTLSEAARKRIDSLSPAQRQLLMQRLKPQPAAASPYVEALSPWIIAQRRPLLDLIAAGELPHVNAVSITCLKQRHLPDGRSIFDVFGHDRGDPLGIVA